ncbi:MAG TPA: pyridoxal 5'-phosphate synthase lyase subunit PdxS [Thermoplasmata archaeon]|nr:pyridoxal 5'-phosphate synthase lyase subunit PdxS [Thermoplasmata archaeon]
MEANPVADPIEKLRFGTELLKRGFARMQQGGVIMDVTTAEQAAIAEEAGAVAVMALERVPADIRAAGGVARMADPQRVREIRDRVSIPVMAKCRIGHTAEARILETLGVDMVDESEVLTPADPFRHVDKKQFKVPFVCGARNLGEALRRIEEGAAMIRTKGEAGTGNVIEAVRHIRQISGEVEEIKKLAKRDLPTWAKNERVSEAILLEVRTLGRLPVVNFAAGGIATPADAALCRMLGVDGVFVGSGIFKAQQPMKVARAIVEASLHYDDPEVLARVSTGLGELMHGTEIAAIPPESMFQVRESAPMTGDASRRDPASA